MQSDLTVSNIDMKFSCVVGESNKNFIVGPLLPCSQEKKKSSFFLIKHMLHGRNGY